MIVDFLTKLINFKNTEKMDAELLSIEYEIPACE